MEHIENSMDSEKSINRVFLLVLRLYGTLWEKRGGGDGGIRTLDTLFKVCSFSKRVPSAARPRLHRLDMPYALTGRKSPRCFSQLALNLIEFRRFFRRLRARMASNPASSLI